MAENEDKDVKPEVVEETPETFKVEAVKVDTDTVLLQPTAY